MRIESTLEVQVMSSDHEVRSPSSPGSAIASWIFGGLLLIVLVAVIFVLPEPTQPQRVGIRFLMALAAAFLSYFFVGKVVLKGRVWGQAVGGGGGFALFIIIQFLSDPFSARTLVADMAPDLVPHDASVETAQEILTKEGLYSGPITGKADSKTREAILAFQKRSELRADGYVSSLTLSRLKTLRQ